MRNAILLLLLCFLISILPFSQAEPVSQDTSFQIICWLVNQDQDTVAVSKAMLPKVQQLRIRNSIADIIELHSQEISRFDKLENKLSASNPDDCLQATRQSSIPESVSEYIQWVRARHQEEIQKLKIALPQIDDRSLKRSIKEGISTRQKHRMLMFYSLSEPSHY